MFNMILENLNGFIVELYIFVMLYIDIIKFSNNLLKLQLHVKFNYSILLVSKNVSSKEPNADGIFIFMICSFDS